MEAYVLIIEERHSGTDVEIYHDRDRAMDAYTDLRADMGLDEEPTADPQSLAYSVSYSGEEWLRLVRRELLP